MKKSVALFLSLLLIAVSAACFASGADLSAIDLSSMTVVELIKLLGLVEDELNSKDPFWDIKYYEELDDTDSPSSGGGAAGNLGDYFVEIKEARTGKDYEGKDVIIVAYEWSHQETEAQTFMWSFNYKAYQDGIELESAYIVEGMNDTAMTSIKSGVSYEVETAFMLRNNTSPVEIEVSELMSFTNAGKVEATINLQ